MTVLLAAPLPPPPPAVNLWPGCSQTWTGWDGSVWNLSGDPASGVRLKEGVRGLSTPPWQRYTSEGPAVAGSSWRGVRAEEREVFWPLGIYSGAGADSDAWLAYDRAFWRTMDPRRVGLWEFRQPNGEVRSLALRFMTDGQHTFRSDPSRLGWARYGVTLVAEQPFWQGTPIRRSWAAPVVGSFFGAGAPSFTIDTGSNLSNAVLDNPGDEDSYPVWTITGPSSSVTVGVGGRNVIVPFALAAGEVLVIDTRPTAQTAITAAGVERTSSLGAVDFAPVPPGTSVVLSLSMSGGGSVAVDLVPLYWRAW